MRNYYEENLSGGTLITKEEFLEHLVYWGDDVEGVGFWVKDLKASDDKINNTPALDATHVIWYNGYNKEV